MQFATSMLASMAVSGTLCLALPSAAGAEVVTLEPIRDNTIFEEGELSNGAGTRFFAGNTAQDNVRRALLAFDVAGSIPAGSTVRNVTLTLQMDKTKTGSQPAELRRLSADWGEGASDAGVIGGRGAPAADGDATWARTFFPSLSWNTPGGDFAAAASASTAVAGPGSYAWGSNPEMVADVQGWLDSPATNFGWILLGNEAATKTAKRFASRESGTESDRPRLDVEFDPPAGETPTVTFTHTPDVAETATITPTPEVAPTETPTPSTGSCPGDCDADGRVTVAELVSAVNIALERNEVSSCAAADRNQDGAVAVNELIAAVNALLTGCG